MRPVNTIRGRVRQRATQRAQLNRMHPGPVPAARQDTPPAEERIDSPPIAPQHPTWWQVYRIELHGTPAREQAVLIAECRLEVEAFAVIGRQAHQCTLTRVGDRRPIYRSFRPPMVVAS
jgi:hypothetical protein